MTTTSTKITSGSAGQVVVALDLADLLRVLLDGAVPRLVRDEPDRAPGAVAHEHLARRVETMWVARSSKTRPMRETTETRTMAAMKQPAIFTPSGRSMTLPTVV